MTARMEEMVCNGYAHPEALRTYGTTPSLCFHQHGMYDKERLFEYRRVSKVNIYSMNEFEDYFYGYMVPERRISEIFQNCILTRRDFVIQMPTRRDPKKVPPFEPQHKLFQVLRESTRWGDMQGIETVGDLNDKITGGGTSARSFLVQEALQEKKIAEIAARIASRAGESNLC